MDIHPLCAILPAMPAPLYKELVNDIRAKGLLHAITIFEGMILDGRHRFFACNHANVPPRFEEYSGNDPVGFVASSCLHRNLTASQRSLIGAGFMAYETEQAKARQKAAGHVGGVVPVNLPEAVKGDARDRAGARVGVGGSTIQHAANVLNRGSPELIEQVRTGEISVTRADKMISKPLPPIVRKDAAVRVSEIQELSARGYRVEQIAGALKIGPEHVRGIARRNNLTLHNVGKGARGINARRVIEHTVFGLEAAAASLETLPVSLDGFAAEEVASWAESITDSIKAFNKFRQQLRSHCHA